MTKTDLVKDLSCFWRRPGPTSNLGHHSVEIWRVRLDVLGRQIENLKKILSPDEKLKAQRFYQPKHKRRYIVAHGILRLVLGRYLNLEPKQLMFTRGLHGKPELVAAVQGGLIHFNMSHSHELALCVFSKKYPVGVDLEHIHNAVDIEAVAKRFFSTREYTALKCLAGRQREEAFFKMWTIKEAYLKATGEGLGGLKGIEVSLGDEQPTSFVKTQAPGHLASHTWSAYLIEPAQGYAGCVVVNSHNTGPSCFSCFEADLFV